MPRFPRISGDIKTDVAIVGGGIAGILAAVMLKRQGVPYVLIEGRRICDGTTGHTTGKITVGHGLIYDKMIKSSGVEIAKGYYTANMLALREYFRLAEGIECDFELKDNLIYSRSERRKLEDEARALERIGARAYLKEELPLPISTVGGVCYPEQAQFNPLKFLGALAEGLNIYENTFAKEIKDGVILTDGGKIRAEKVIVATHFPIINRHGSYFMKLYQNRSYVLGIENAEDVSGMYLDEAEGGFSFRNYKNMLLLGGGSHRTGSGGACFDELRAFARKVYPEAKEKYAFAAQDCMSLDSRPYIGRYSARTQDLYVATGFNKWGMTGAMAAAMILADEIVGKKSDFREVFSPSRSILRPQLAVNGFETVKNLLTFTGKRCPHMGCALKWNKAERSWDCPCHGSRFDEDGRLIENPAKRGL